MSFPGFAIGVQQANDAKARQQGLQDQQRQAQLANLYQAGLPPEQMQRAIGLLYQNDPSALRQHIDNLGRRLSGQQPVPPGAQQYDKQVQLQALAAGGTSPEQRQMTMEDRKAAAALQLQQLRGQQAQQKTSQSRPVPGYSEAVNLQTATAQAQNGQVYMGADGKPIDVGSIPPGNILVPIFQGGGQSYWTIATDRGRYETAGNQRLLEPAVGGPNPAAPSIGAARVGNTHTSVTTDPFGVTSTTQSSTTPQGAPAASSGGVSPARSAPAPRRGTAQRGAPSQTQGDKKLDASGHIPPNSANPQLVQAANSIIDGMDVDKLPIPQRDRAAAMALASQYGYQGQGAFTPSQKILINEAGAKLKQLGETPYLKVLDSASSRAKIATVLSGSDPKAGTVHNVIAGQVAGTLTPDEQGFIRDYNAAVGVISGLGPITRGNRATEAAVQRLMVELPSVLQSGNSSDARQRVKQLLQEIDVAKEPSSATSLGPRSGSGPSDDDIINALNKKK